MRRVLGFLFVLAGASFAAASGDQTPPTSTKTATPANAPSTKSTTPATPAKPGTSTPAPKAGATATVSTVKVKAKVIMLAPADEYFGPLKMSVLGIRNEIHDLAIRYDVKSDGDHALAKQIMGTAVMTEASLADWEKKYPADDQLARDVYLLQHLYAKIDFDTARSKAKYCAQWLFSRYPKSWYAKNLHLTWGRDTSPTSANPDQPAGGPSTTSPGAPVPPTSSQASGAPAVAPPRLPAPQSSAPASIPPPAVPAGPSLPAPLQSAAPTTTEPAPTPAPSST